MSYITRISLKGLDDEAKRKVMEALRYCEQHDKYKTFTYETAQHTIYIHSPTKDTAYLRGMYFYKKFGLFFKVEKQNQKTI